MFIQFGTNRVGAPVSVFSITLSSQKTYYLLPVTLLPIISSRNDVPCAFQYVQKQNVTRISLPTNMEAVVSHILLRINPSAMEITSPMAGRKAKKCHQCSFSLQESYHLVYSSLL